MSSMGVMGTSPPPNSGSVCDATRQNLHPRRAGGVSPLSLWPNPTNPEHRELTPPARRGARSRRAYPFIALRANLRNPLAWQAVIRLKSEENGVSRSARRTIVVGRPPVAVGLQPGGLEVELDEVGLVLDLLDRLVARSGPRRHEQVALACRR